MAVNLSLAKAFVELSLKGSAAVISGVNEIRSRVMGALAPLGNAFTPAQQGMLNFAAAASPQAFNTFQGSMRILAATIGKEFVPYVIEASRWIQRTANYIRDMDPETKKQIVSWAATAVAVMGAVKAFGMLNDMFSLIAKHPVAAAFLVIAAAVMKVNQAMNQMQESMNKSIDTMERMKKGTYTEGEYKRSAAAAIETDDSMTEEQKLAKAKETLAKVKAEGRAMSKEGKNRDALSSTMDAGLGMAGFGNNKNNELQYSIGKRMNEAGMLEDYIKRLETNKGGPKFTKPEDINKPQKDLLLAGAGIGGGGGQSTSLENAFMQTSQNALAADDIQQKIMQLQQEGNAAAQKSAMANERTANTLESMTRK